MMAVSAAEFLPPCVFVRVIHKWQANQAAPLASQTQIHSSEVRLVGRKMVFWSL